MVDPAHAVLAGKLVKVVDQLDPVFLLAIDRHRLAVVEADLHFLGLVGCLAGIDCPLEGLRGWLDPGVFENACLDRPAPEVLVGAEDRLLGGLDLDAVLGGELELLRSRPLPLAHRGHDFQVWGQGLKGDVEPDLIVPLARAAMSHRHGAVLAGHANHELGDQGPPQRRGQGILALVERAGQKRRPDEIVDEQVTRVLGDRLDRSGAQSPSGGSPGCPAPDPGRRCRRSRPCRKFR